MSVSDISRISRRVSPPTHMAATVAKDMALRRVAYLIKQGLLNKNDKEKIDLEYRSTYMAEYYKYHAQYYANNCQQQPSVVYLHSDTLHSKRYYRKHTVANFSRLNHFVRVCKDRITVGRFQYPTDQDFSPETKEAFLPSWPGPLDRKDIHLKYKVTEYMDTLWQHDSQRRIRYLMGTCDEQRKTILTLLTELLHRSGTIDAPTTTRILLRPQETEIPKDQISKKPLESLQKYLLLGKRSEAFRFAKSNKLWDHAQCIAFLDKYQPQNNIGYNSDGQRLKDDSIVQLNEDFIASLKPDILQTVYRCLLGRVYESDPKSVNILKPPDVGNSSYDFAMLSANDCAMEYDQSNEIFKLITASKKVLQDSSSAYKHLISLGFSSIQESGEPSEDLSFRSHVSFNKIDSHALNTLTITNIDLLILNEVWEYCLNLARGTNNPANYDYIVDLLPSKLVFASKLFDFGLIKGFSNYLNSISNAFYKIKAQQRLTNDGFYNWDAIERAINILRDIYGIFHISPEAPSHPIDLSYQEPPEFNSMINEVRFNHLIRNTDEVPVKPQAKHIFEGLTETSLPRRESSGAPPEKTEYSRFNDQPQRRESGPTALSQVLQQQPPPPLEHLQAQSQAQPQITQGFGSGTPSYPQGAGSSDIEAINWSQMVDQIDPSQQLDQDFLISQQNGRPPVGSSSQHSMQFESSSRQSMQVGSSSLTSPTSVNQPIPPANKPVGAFEDSGQDLSSMNAFSPISHNEDLPKGGRFETIKQDSPPPLQSGFLTNLVGTAKALLPKSNSKPMILPDDKEKTLYFDTELQMWVDKEEGVSNKPELTAPPPVAKSTQQPTSYTMGQRSTKSRYPTPMY